MYFLAPQQEEAYFQGLPRHLLFCVCDLPALASPVHPLGWLQGAQVWGRSSHRVPWAQLGVSGAPAVGHGAQAARWLDFPGKCSKLKQIPVSLLIQVLRGLAHYP